MKTVKNPPKKIFRSDRRNVEVNESRLKERLDDRAVKAMDTKFANYGRGADR